jgi:PAS domain S-box-containing protein
MINDIRTVEQLRRENQDLRFRLEEVEGIVRAISDHEVDAFVVNNEGSERVLVLDGVDRPYRLLIERMQQGAAVLMRDGSIIYANKRLADMLGVSLESLPGTPLTAFFDNANRHALDALLANAAVGDAAQELTLLRQDGSSFPALLSVSPLVEPTDIICMMVTDLTQQKRHEEERAARAAAEQAAQFLRAADERKNEFLAILGHELRNPLAPLRNGLQVLKLKGSKDLATEQIREMMARQLESLARLVDDLLDVPRVAEGQIELKLERTDLKLAVLRAVESCRALVDAHRHRLELDLPPNPVLVEADAIRLTQVISNLLNNAAKFTPSGGHIGVSVAGSADARQAVVSVRDNGRGIASEMLTRIFDLYTQADPSMSRTEGGLGIGLALARRIVELHGGTLEASSPGLGRGSEFVMKLPLAACTAGARSERSERPDVNPTGALPSRRILVIDDNRDSAASLVMLLRLSGHEVRDANDGRQALAILEDFVPELVLLDLGMPGMSGYEVARRIRSDPRYRDVRIVAVSGYGSAEDRQRTKVSGFHDHLVKPIELAALQAILSSVPLGTNEN